MPPVKSLDSYSAEMPESNIERKCGNCEFKDFLSECHRNPPQVIKGDIFTRSTTEFPRVKDFDCCGEFKLKKKNLGPSRPKINLEWGFNN